MTPENNPPAAAPEPIPAQPATPAAEPPAPAAEPPAPAAEPATEQACGECNNGIIAFGTDDVTCAACGGTGKKP